MEFSEHGEFEVVRDGVSIFVTAKGSFNENGGRKYCSAIEQEVEALIGKPYKILVDLSELEGCTQECWALLHQHNQNLAKTNLVAKALVVKGYLVAEYVNRANKEARNFKTAIFSDSESATQWLERQES